MGAEILAGATLVGILVAGVTNAGRGANVDAISKEGTNENKNRMDDDRSTHSRSDILPSHRRYPTQLVAVHPSLLALRFHSFLGIVRFTLCDNA